MASEIHPSAIIDSNAQVGDNVRIGPYCVINAGVKIGGNCHLANHVTIEGPTEIGEGNHFFPYASIGQRTQDLKYDGEPTYLKIGDHNTFREFCTVNRHSTKGESTMVGNHGNFMAYSHIGHDCIVGDHVILSNNGTLGGHVVVEDYAIISGLTAVHQFCRIGAHSMLGGCSKVIKDIPPFMIADGNPTKVRAVNSIGLKRRGFSDDTILQIKKAHRFLYRENLNTSEAIAAMEEMEDTGPEISAIISFVRNSDRGIH